MPEIALFQAAHGRTGDKGNRSNISVIAYDDRLWETLVQQVTEERVATYFKSRNPSNVKRYLLPNLHSMNFVIDDVLDGGVNSSLNLDSHGKALSFDLLQMTINVEQPLLPYCKGLEKPMTLSLASRPSA